MRSEQSDGIGIRRYRLDDIPLLFEAAHESIADIYPWMEWCHPTYAIEESTAWVLSREQAWNDGNDFSFAICDTRSGAYLGGVGVNQLNHLHGFANLGYWVRSRATGRGIAAAATVLAARFAFEELRLHRCEIVAAVQNVRSQRVAEKAGATREGILRNRLFIHDRAHDAVMFSLTPKGTRV